MKMSNLRNSPEHKRQAHEKAKDILSKISTHVAEAEKKIAELQDGKCKNCGQGTLKLLEAKVKSLRSVENRLLRRG